MLGRRALLGTKNCVSPAACCQVQYSICCYRSLLISSIYSCGDISHLACAFLNLTHLTNAIGTCMCHAPLNSQAMFLMAHCLPVNLWQPLIRTETTPIASCSPCQWRLSQCDTHTLDRSVPARTCGINFDGSPSHLPLECFRQSCTAQVPFYSPWGSRSTLLRSCRSLINSSTSAAVLSVYSTTLLPAFKTQSLSKQCQLPFNFPLRWSTATPAAQTVLPVAVRRTCWKCPLRQILVRSKDRRCHVPPAFAAARPYIVVYAVVGLQFVAEKGQLVLKIP